MSKIYERVKIYCLNNEDCCCRILGFVFIVLTIWSIEMTGFWPSYIAGQIIRPMEFLGAILGFQEIVRPYISVRNYLQDKLIDAAYDRLFEEEYEVKDD